MSKSFKISKSAKADYSPAKSQGSALELNINSRGVPTVLQFGTSNPDGDHVTAVRLIEEGLYRRLDNIRSNETVGLSEKTNRDSLRNRRSFLLNYLSAIAILDPARTNPLYQVIDDIFSDYGRERHKKTGIKQTANNLHADQSLTGLPYEEALKGLDSKFRENGDKMRLVFSQISKAIVTFYNKIPLTQYHNIPGFTEGSGNIKSSVGVMQDVMNWYYSKREPIGSAVMSAKREQIINCVNAFIHYPEITNPQALLDHQNLNLIDRKGRDNRPRNNEKPTLVALLAKHFHIFSAAYPEAEYFNQNGELLDGFVDKFIGKGTPHPNWPTFATNPHIQEIKAGVRAEVIRLSNLTTASHYNNWKAQKKAMGYNLDSSDDEEISVKIKIKSELGIAESKVKPEIKLEITEAEIELMRKKMEELDLLKQIISENRSSIPQHVIELLERAYIVPHSQPTDVKPPITTTIPSLNNFNRVTETSNLTHQNVLFLTHEAFKAAGQEHANHDCAVISEDALLDHSLRNAILKFIGQESEKTSIALCKGQLNSEKTEIIGDTHWTALHLRKVKDKDGKISIYSYHMDSLSTEVPLPVERVLKSIKNTTLGDLGGDLSTNETYQNAIKKLPHLNIGEPLASQNQRSKQNDGYSCGYHAVFNMIRMNNANLTGGSWICQDGVAQNGQQNIAVQDFIKINKPILEQRFNTELNPASNHPSTSTRTAGSKSTTLKPVAHQTTPNYLNSK